MPSLIIIDSKIPEYFINLLIEQGGYEKSVSGNYLITGQPGSLHWPIKEDLPGNILHHPTQDAKDSAQHIYSWVKSEGVVTEWVLAFDTPDWHVVFDNPKFEHKKPSVNWEGLLNRSRKAE